MKKLYNIDKRQTGFWIRPAQDFNSSDYIKLYVRDAYVHNDINWQSEESKKQDAFVLNFQKDISKWTIYRSDKKYQNLDYVLSKEFNKDNLIEYDNSFAVSKFMKHNMHSMLECLDMYDLSWSKIYDTTELFEDYDGKDVVWKVMKHWTNDGTITTADTVQEEFWLDRYEKQDDGSDRWFSIKQKPCLSEDKKYWYTEDAVVGQITRHKTKTPYCTAEWIADIPDMFSQFSRIGALHNASELCLSYIANSPLQIKYVVAKAYSRKTYEELLMKNKEWSVYDYYVKDTKADLYPDFMFDVLL